MIVTLSAAVAHLVFVLDDLERAGPDPSLEHPRNPLF
jgi:hypothetical protein